MQETMRARQPKVTICGIDELGQYASVGVTHVLSILDPQTTTPVAFERFGAHERLELRFHDVIEERMLGYDSPQPHHIQQLLTFGRTLGSGLYPDPHILVHCHMGISRSTAAAALLLAEANPRRAAEEIVAEIVGIRDRAWPNLRMIEIGDSMLGRGGRLIRAVQERHRQLAVALPHVADFMRSSGRSRELD